MIKYVYGFIILTAIGILYEKYKQKFVPDEELGKYDLIAKFLLNGEDPDLAKKPLLWIYTDRETNSRWWPSFHSRNTRDLNQPYIISCVETIVKKCGKSFNIVLIDETSFPKLIPGWNVQLKRLADPVKSSVTKLAMAKLLHRYGGMLVPNSTIVMKDLKPVYDSALRAHTCFAVEGINKASNAAYYELFPMDNIIGCRQNSPVMKEYIQFLGRNISTDYTAESNFLGESNRWLYKAKVDNKVSLINAKFFGMINKKCELVNLDDLMGNTFIEFDDSKLYAIYIPRKEILERTSYQWFARLSQKHLRSCDTMAAKYLLLAQEGI
jgi:hypothetical protein